MDHIVECGVALFESKAAAAIAAEEEAARLEREKAKQASRCEECCCVMSHYIAGSIIPTCTGCWYGEPQLELRLSTCQGIAVHAGTTYPYKGSPRNLLVASMN
jgi:hypothetical protein